MRKHSYLFKYIALVAVMIAVICVSVFSGCKMSSRDWMLKTISENYYDCSGKLELDTSPELSLKEIAAQLDRYSDYYTAEEYLEVIKSNSGSQSGIGITYNFIEGKGAMVIQVIGNSPAYGAGIKPGDVFVSGAAADGKIVDFNEDSDFTSFMTDRATGEKFVLSTAEKSYEISREEYTASYTCMYTSDTEWFFKTNDSGKLSLESKANTEMDFLPEHTAYLRLTQFFGTAGKEFGELIEQFNAAQCTSLILDLRNDGGGYVTVMQDIAGYFVSSLTSKTSVAMTAKYKNGETETYNCTKQKGDKLVPAGTQVYVLANSGTASASEALIGVLVSYDILKYENIFLSDFSEEYLAWAGEDAKTKRSYGKGIMQTTYVNFRTGEALKLTTAKIYWPNGECIHDVGLTEEKCRLAPAEWTATKGDNELRYVCETYLG